jgi:hypothetical protein
VNSIVKTLAGGTAGLLATALLVGCGGDPSGDATAPGTDDLQQVQRDSGVPEECLTAFPVAMSAPDLGEVTLLPADWPEAPEGATLCQTGATLDGGVETVDYVTDRAAADVLADYEAALSGYDVVRADEGLGEQLSGTAGSVSFEITTRDGAYSVLFAEAG